MESTNRAFDQMPTPSQPERPAQPKSTKSSRSILSLRSFLPMTPPRRPTTSNTTLNQNYTTENLISFLLTESSTLQIACDHLPSKPEIEKLVRNRINNICRWLHQAFTLLKIHTPVSRAVLNPDFHPNLFFRFIELISEGGDQDLDYSRKQLVKLLDGAIEGRGPWGCESGSRGEKEAWRDFHEAVNAAVRLYGHGYTHKDVGIFVGYVRGLCAVVVERREMVDLRLYGPKKKSGSVTRIVGRVLGAGK